MLKQLEIKQFTVFPQANFQFSPGLNVIIGDNGTGKTHLLKLGYLFSQAWPDLMKKPLRLDRKRTEAYFEERLAGLFRIPELAGLIRKGHKNGIRLAAQVIGQIPTLRVTMPGDRRPPGGIPEPMPWEINLLHGKEAPAKIKAAIIPEEAAVNAFMVQSIYIPAKEIVSMFKGLIGLFENYRQFPLDETYRDLAVALSTLEPSAPSRLLGEVEERIGRQLGGELRLEKDDFVFVEKDGHRRESQLMAEGHRKLALLLYLVRNRLVEAGGTIFWDEPEANLNPAAIRLLAEALYTLAEKGVQIIVATHSLFLLREFELLTRGRNQPPAATRYFSLGLTRKGVTVSAGDDTAAIDPLVLLDEDLAQSDRFIASQE